MPVDYPKTRLEILMRLANVTGKTLSNSLHVDMSLVSRWKNGVRSLVKNSEQLEKICDFFIGNNHGENLPIIHKIIIGKSTSALITMDEAGCLHLKRQLAIWLLEPLKINEYLLFEQQETFNDDENKQKFYISFNGNEGRRQAMVAFLENILQFKEPHRILIMDEENYEWLRESQIYLNSWKKKMLDILGRGHQLVIIRGTNKRLDSLFDEIVEWMPLYLTGQIGSYVGMQISSEFPTSLYILEDICALSGFEVDKEERFTAFTNDPLTIQSFQKMFEKALLRKNPFIKVFNRSNIQKAIQDIIIAGENNDPSYYMANELFFTNMREDLLSDILKNNSCTVVEEEIVLNFHKRLNQNFDQNVRLCENHHIYNYKSLEKCAKQTSYLNSHLSIITGRDIYMTRQDFIRHIEGTMRRIEKNADFDVALTSDNAKAPMLEEHEIWIKDGHYICTWSNKAYEHIIISLEPSVTHVFTEYYRQLWNSILVVEKDKKAVIEKFEKILKLARRLEVLENSHEK